MSNLKCEKCGNAAESLLPVKINGGVLWVCAMCKSNANTNSAEVKSTITFEIYSSLKCQARFDSVTQINELELLNKIAEIEKTPCILKRVKQRIARINKKI